MDQNAIHLDCLHHEGLWQIYLATLVNGDYIQESGTHCGHCPSQSHPICYDYGRNLR